MFHNISTISSTLHFPSRYIEVEEGRCISAVKHMYILITLRLGVSRCLDVLGYYLLRVGS
jgi:hypothetical protein